MKTEKQIKKEVREIIHWRSDILTQENYENILADDIADYVIDMQSKAYEEGEKDA